jgi:hypothetical protein
MTNLKYALKISKKLLQRNGYELSVFTPEP